MAPELDGSLCRRHGGRGERHGGQQGDEVFSVHLPIIMTQFV
jgi:hypothetical protein